MKTGGPYADNPLESQTMLTIVFAVGLAAVKMCGRSDGNASHHLQNQVCILRDDIGGCLPNHANHWQTGAPTPCAR